MPDPKKNILESIFPKDFQQKESSLFQQASGGKFVDHSDFSEASKGDMNSFLISSRRKLEEKKRKAQEEERKQREAQVSEASNEIGNTLSQMQEYEASLPKDEKGNTVLTKEDEQALLELAQVAEGLYKQFPEAAEQHKKKIRELEEKRELAKKFAKDKLPINPYLSVELGENVENKISNLRNTLNVVQKSQSSRDVVGDWILDKALGIAEGIIGTVSNTKKQIYDHFTMSSVLSEEEMEEYNNAKEGLAKLEAPVAYARSKQASLLIQELEEYLESDDYSYIGDRDRVNVLLHKLKRTRKYQNDIYRGDTSLSLDVAVRELVGRNFISLNSSRSEFALLPGMQEELLDLITGASNIGEKWEEKTLEYAKETGKKLEDFTPEDFESVKNSMSKLDQLNLRTMILTSSDHEVEEFVSLGYKTMMGTAHSVGMMGGFVAGNYGSALVKNSGRQFLNGYKGVTKATIKARKMADQVSKTPSLKGVLTSTGEGLMGTVIGGTIQPMFINEELRNKSDWGWVKDNEGKLTGIAAGTAFKEHKINQLKEEKQYYKELVEKAEEYGVNNLSENEREQYLHALALLGQGEYKDEEGRKVQPLDAQIELLRKTPDSKFKSYLKGFANFGVEKFAEFSTTKGLSALGKGAGKLGESVVGKTNAKLIREKANSLTNDAKRGYYSSYIGSKHRQFEKLSQNFVKPGGEKMIHSLGTEIVEEYVAELGQALVDMTFDGFENGLGPLNEAFHTMTTWDFNRDVALQTLTMKGFFGLAGSAKRGSLLGYSKVYENRMNSRLEKLEDLKKQLDSSDLTPQEKVKLTKQYNKLLKLTTDSQKNRTISGKKYLSSVGKAATETKMELERNKAQEKLIQQLEARGELDAETKDLLKGMDMTAESINEKQRRIAVLNSKGKYKEAAMLEQNMMSNLIENSIHYENVGTIKKALYSALTDSSKSKDMQTARNMQSLLRTVEKLEKHFNENGYSPRTKIAGKVILQQGLIQNSIDNFQESLRLSSEEARKDLVENPGTIDLGSLSKDEALMALSEDTSNPFEEGTEKYEDFENLQIGLVEYAETNNSDLAKHIKTRENLNRAKQSLESSKKRFSEAMNPGMQTIISESALKDIVPALNEEIKSKGRLLTKEELDLFLDKNDKLISQDADKVTKQKIKTRIKELHNATKALQEKFNKEDSQRLAQAKKEEVEDAPKEDEGEVVDTSQESRESRKVVENIENKLSEETNLGEPDVGIFNDNKNDEELNSAEIDPSQEAVGEKAYSIDLNEESQDSDSTEEDSTPKQNLDDIFKGLEGDMSIDTSSMGEIPLDQNLVDQVKEEVYSMIDILQSVGKTEVTFTDVINELLSYESVPGLLTQGKGFRYLIRAWEAVHNEKGKGEAFKKGEIQAMRDQMQSLSKSSQTIQEALEKRKDEAIKHSTVNTKLLPDGNNDKANKESASIEQTSEAIEKKNNPVKREEKEEKGKTLVANTEGKKGMPPRLGYLGLSYERVEDERGGVTTRTTDFEKTQREKSEGGKWIVVDPRLLSHPDNTQTLELDVEIAKEEDWDKVMMTEGEADRLNKRPIVISFKEWVEKREATNPDFRNTEEFYANVPIFVNRGGKRAAYVHTQDWFNGFTVPSPTKNIPGTPDYIHPSDYKSDPSWESAVEQAKQRNAEVRKAILLGKNPPTKLKVNRKGESVAAKINDDMPAIPVSEANPQAQLFVMTSNDMKSMIFNDLAFEKGKDKGFKEGSKILLNDPSEFTYPDGGAKKGHVFALYKVDSIKNEEGKVVERYRAFPLQRKINTPEGAKVFTEQMNSVLHAFAIHEVLNGNKVSNPEFDISLEDARKFNTDLARTSNMDLSSVNGFTKYFNQFLKLGPSSVKELNERGLNRLIKKNINSGLSKEEAKKKAQEEYNTNKGRDYLGFKLELIDLMSLPANKRFNHFSKRVVQNTQAYLLNNETKPVSYINNLGVQSTGKTYHEYLKDNLTTVFKAFNMAQEGEKDAYTASVQPVWEIQDNFENMEYEEVGHSTFKQRQKQEVKTLEQELFGGEDVTLTEGLSEQQKAEIENFISEYLNTNLDFFIEISNRQSELETVIDAVALSKKFNGEVAGLPQHIALPFINLIANTVVRKAEFRSSLSKDSMEQIKAIARRRVGLHTSKVIKGIQERIDTLEEAYKDSTELSAEQESLLTALDYNLELMEKIKKEETFDLLFDQAKLKVSQLAGVKEMDSKESEGLSEEQANEKNYSKDSVEETVKSKATGKIKMLLSGIPIYDNNGNIMYDYAGIPAYMSLDDVYNLVLKTLSIGIDPKGDYDYMISKLKESSHPAIQEVIKRLENSDGQLKNQFVVNSARHSIQSKFTMYEVNPTTGETNLKVYNTNSGTIVRSVIDNWKNNTTNSDLYNFDGSLNVAFATEIRKTMRELPANMESFDFVAVKDIFTKIGLELHPKTWEDLEKRGMASGTKTYSLEGMWRDYKNGSKDFSIFSSIDEALKQAIENPAEHSAQGKTLYDNNVGAINGIAKIEAENNPELVSLVYRDSGKTISTLTPPKLVTDEISKILHSLNEDGEYVDQIKNISFSSNSMILQYLEDSVEFREFFGISHKSLTSLKDRNKSSNKEKKTNSLDTPEFLLDALGAFQDRKIAKMKSIEEQGVATRLAHMFFPTMSDKDTSLVLNTVVLDLLNSENNFVVEGDNVSVSDIVLNIMFDRMVQNQIDKIIKFHQNKGKTNIKSYDSAAGLFINLPGLNALQIEGQNLVSYLEALSTKDMDIDMEAIRNVVLPYLKGLVESELNTKFELVKKFGLTQSNVKGEKKTINRMVDSTYVKESGLKEKDPTKDEVIKKALLDFVVNDLITQSEIQKLFVSDPALYFKHKFPKDKNIYNLSTQEYINMAKDTGVNLGKRLASQIAPGEKSAKTNQKYKQIFLKDPVDISQNIGQLIDWFYPEKSEKFKELVADFSKKVAGTQEYGNALSKLEKEMPIIAGYLELESADAQEYTTVAEHLNVMYIYGKITEEQYNKLLNAYEKGGLKNLSKEDQRIVMQPMKPVHTGIYNDAEQDVRRVVYIKSSSIPLFPEFTKNSQLDNLRVAMEELEKNSVDEKGDRMYVRASYQTANKVGALKETVDIYNQESIGKINLENSGVSLTLDRNNFRIQQEVPHKSSKKGVDKVSMGTQIFKLLFGDGILDTKGEVFPYKGKKVSATELKKEFDRSFNEIYDLSKANLYEELGLDEKGNVESSYTFRIALSELLKKEALERGYDLRSIEGLNLVSEQGEAKFVVPLWLSSDANRMEALLNSILTNRLMQMKLPGNGFVAASESGIQQKEFDQISPEDRNNIIYLEGWDGKELKATRDKNGEIQSAQVMVESKFKNAEGELIDLFEDFNGEEGKYIKTNDNGSLGLKTEMFDKEILNMFTFRTPTSGHVSASSVEVVGILPPQSGDVMVVPKNFTKQKGLDFDVDKESAYILNHYIDSEGRVRVYDDNFSKELDKLLEEEVTPNGYIYSSLFEEFNITYLLANNDPRFNGLNSKLNRNKVYKLAKLLDWQNNSNKKYTQFENVVSSLFDVTSSENSVTLTEQINELKEELYKKESPENVDKVVKELVNSFSSSEINSFDNKMNKLLLAKIRNQAKNKLKKKMAENDFIRTHLSVFNTSDVEVQKKINRILSMDFAQSQAEQIEELTNEGIKNVELQKIQEEFKAKGKNLSNRELNTIYNERNSYFNLLSHDYQKSKSDLGAIGKQAIGIYSVAVTFNSLVQQAYGSEGMEMSEFTIGNISSNSLGGRMASGQNYTTAEALQEKQNTATDNEKEQILGRVGVDAITITADSHGTLRGFGKDENGNSVLYNLLSQPIVKEYSKRLKESKGMLGEYIEVKDLVNELMQEIGSEYKLVEDPVSGKLIFVQGNQEVIEKGSKVLTGDVLLDGITKGSISNKYQDEALRTFIQLDIEGKEFVSKISSLNNNTLGKSIIGVEVMKERLENTLKDPAMIPLFGKRVGYGTPDSFPIIKKTALGIETYGVLPTTSQGKIAIDGFLTHEKLFKDLFPYKNQGLKNTLNSILLSKGIETDMAKAEDYESIIVEMRKYIFSSNTISVHNSDANNLRKHLMTEGKNKPSLAKYIKDVLDTDDKNSEFSRGIKVLKNNPLIGKKLKYLISKDSETGASTIEYNNAQSEHIDDSILYSALPQLVQENALLPNKDGEPYDTKMLVEDLVRYSFLQGGVQEATEFIKYVPIELLSSMYQGETSISKSLRGLHSEILDSVHAMEELLESFPKQYFQNNPSEARFLGQAKKEGDFRLVEGRFVNAFFRQGKGDKTVLYETEGGIVQKDGKTYTRLKQIPITKVSKISQYNPQGVSVNIKGENSKGTIYSQFNSGIKTYSKIGQLLADARKSTNPGIKAITEIVAQRVDLETPLKGFTQDPRKGISSSKGIYLNMDVFNVSNQEEMFATALHEVFHQIMGEDFKNYYHINNQGQYTLREKSLDGSPIPSAILNANVVFTDAVAGINNLMETEYGMSPDKISELRSIFSSVVESSKTSNPELFKASNSRLRTILQNYSPQQSQEIITLIYGTINPNEMFAHLIETPIIREALNKIPYRNTNKSLFQKIIEAFKDLVKTIFPQVEKGSLAEAGLSSMIELLESKQIINELETLETEVEETPTGPRNVETSTVDLIKQEKDLKEESEENAEEDASFNIPLLASTQESKVEFDLNSVKVLADLSKPVNKKAQRKGYREAVPQALTLRRGKEAYWRKQLAKKGVDKVQIDLIFNYLEDNNIEEISTEELAMEIASKYSFAVEVNTATEYREIKKESFTYGDLSDTEKILIEGGFEIDTNSASGKGLELIRNILLQTDNEGNHPYMNDFPKTTSSFFYTVFNKAYPNTVKPLTWEELKSRKLEEIKKANSNNNTQHYSNLTVPGGTNYIENEISTPLITPSIKGHAQFATGNGIGWFRSDDKLDTKTGSETISEYRIGTTEDLIAGLIEPEEVGKDVKIVRNNNLGTTESKTRRILEMQSDLFQKGRDKFSLIKNLDLAAEQGLDLEEVKKSLPNELKQNQFLQLLNRDNNWVSFFIKSIIQDSSKKGYEKVLFPKKDTVAKIEGHTSAQEMAEQKERTNSEEIDKRRKLDSELSLDRLLYQDEIFETYTVFRPEYYVEKKGAKQIAEGIESKEEAEKIAKETYKEFTESNNRRIEELQREIDTTKEQLKPAKSVQDFYETTLNNSLRKIVDKKFVSDITDEYGNNWTQIDIQALLLDEMMNAKRQDFALLDGINEISDPTLENSVNFAITDSGQTVADLGITQSEWDTLSALEKNNLKKCN